MILRLNDVCKRFTTGQDIITVLSNVNFAVNEGESVALVAPSGSGKSTLLQIAAILDKPTSGNVWIDGKNTNNLSDSEKSKLRANCLGFVYQFHNLLPDFTALENVMMPLLICGYTKREASTKELLGKMKLSHRINHKPNQLSGGEQQRVSIARAIINQPKIIFADEPTGNLDPSTAAKVFDLFMQYVSRYKCTLIMATHNIDLAIRLDRQVTIENGKIVSWK